MRETLWATIFFAMPLVVLSSNPERNYPNEACSRTVQCRIACPKESKTWMSKAHKCHFDHQCKANEICCFRYCGITGGCRNECIPHPDRHLGICETPTCKHGNRYLCQCAQGFGCSSRKRNDFTYCTSKMIERPSTCSEKSMCQQYGFITCVCKRPLVCTRDKANRWISYCQAPPGIKMCHMTRNTKCKCRNGKVKCKCAPGYQCTRKRYNRTYCEKSSAEITTTTKAPKSCGLGERCGESDSRDNCHCEDPLVCTRGRDRTTVCNPPQSELCPNQKSPCAWYDYPRCKCSPGNECKLKYQEATYCQDKNSNTGPNIPSKECSMDEPCSSWGIHFCSCPKHFACKSRPGWYDVEHCQPPPGVPIPKK